MAFGRARTGAGARKPALLPLASAHHLPHAAQRRLRLRLSLLPPAMLAYGLKIVWFTLSLAGLLSSWITLPAFPTTIVRGLWVQTTYGVVNTMLQGIFCLGLIWRMDPFQMPRGFCIAQTTIMHLSWSCIAGLTAAITLKSARKVFGGTSLGGLLQVLSGVASRIVLIGVFPAVVFAIQLGFVLKLDAAAPADDLNCDASHPTWVRVLGYSGTSLLLAIPSFILSVVTGAHTLSPSALQRNSPPTPQNVYNNATLTSLPTRRPRRNSKHRPRLIDSLEYSEEGPTIVNYSTPRLPKTLFPPDYPISPISPTSPGRAPTQAKHSKFHLPFNSPPSPVYSAPPSRASTYPSRNSPLFDRVSSRQDSYRGPPSPIVFASPSRAESRKDGPAVPHEPTVVHISPSPLPGHEKDSSSTMYIHPQDIDLVSDDVIAESLRWADESDEGSVGKFEYGYAIGDDDGLEEPSSYAFPPYPRIRRSISGQPPWLEDTDDTGLPIGRIILFQLFLSITLIVAAISSLVDIFSQHSLPASFGTQHVALLMAAWAPSLFASIATLMDHFSISTSATPTNFRVYGP